MSLQPYVSSMLYIPKRLLSKPERQSLRDELTISFDQGLSGPTGESDIVEVKCYDTSVRGYIGVPRQLGITRYPRMEYDDLTITGNDVSAAYKGIKAIKPRDDAQRDFFREIAINCKIKERFNDYVAVAKTGSGKTAATINSFVENKQPVLVLVHTNRLKEQWLGSAEMKNGLRFFFGEKFVDDYVGIVQQGVCDYENKAVCVGLIHSVAKREYPAPFYKHFSAVIFDELHKHTAPNFAGAIMKFPQRVRGGMTATLREDALRKVALWHFGEVKINSKQEVMKPKVYICKWVREYKENQNKLNLFSKGTMLNSLSSLQDRNALIAKIAYKRGYQRKRQVLVISDRVHQLIELRQRLIAYGVPKNKVGLYVGRVYTGKFKCTVIAKDADGNTIRHRLTMNDGSLFPNRGLARKAARQFIQGDGFDGKVIEIKIEEDTYKVSEGSYKRMERVCSIFLATYGVFSTGNDISRLDMGIEATPQPDPRQPVGRVVRLGDNKQQPEWYSIFDEISIENGFGEPELVLDLMRSNVARKKRFEQMGADIVTIKDVEAKFGD